MDKDELLKQYPWEKEYHALDTPPVEWFWSFESSLSPEEIWPLISDTSRLNRALGLSQMKFEEKEGILHGEAVSLGIRLSWIEVPWNWVYGKNIISIRKYSKGFAKLVKAIFHLEKKEDKTEITVYFGWVPGNLFYKLFIKGTEKGILSRYKKIFKSFEEEKKAGNPLVRVLENNGTKNIQPVLTDKIDESISLLKRYDLNEGDIRTFLHYILNGDELDLDRIRVLKLAESLKINAKDLLKVCLYATKAGILKMSWDLICPHCRGVRGEIQSLFEVPISANCEVCGIEFENSSENSLEVTFHIHPSIRNIPKILYCSAEPAKKNHIKVQKLIAPEETFEYKLQFSSGVYRVRKLGEKQFQTINLVDYEKPSVIELNSDVPEDSGLFGINSFLRVRNKTKNSFVLIVEENEWDKYSLKPLHLFNLPEFYKIFPEERISPDLNLEIGVQTILFTDIVGSSGLYNINGDSLTFSKVKRHFEDIHSIIIRYNGVIVKTIGDAVMAGFLNSESALKASLDLIKFFKKSEIKIRISANTGKCIAVNLNTGIDYFGKTVNIAAKIQKFAGESQFVFTESFYNSGDVQKILNEENLALSELEYEMAGTFEKIKVYRI